ncbi:MAG: hypothetical protein HY835_01650, partial [Anaerolineae bacterium]|nr:hypothetical protein [Anaerolineae bacterium]
GNPIEREDYRQRLARLIRVDERALMGIQAGGALPGQARRRPQFKTPEKDKPTLAPRLQPGRALEAHLLRLLLRNPEVLFSLNRLLQQARLAHFSAQDFEEVDHQELSRLLAQSLEQDQMDASRYIAEYASDTLQETLHAYMEPFQGSDPTAQRIFEDIANTLLRLRETRVRQNLDQLRYLLDDVKGQAELRANIDEQAKSYAETLDRLHKAPRLIVNNSGLL